jgi:hypothetical protein
MESYLSYFYGAVMKRPVLWEAGTFLTSWTTISKINFCWMQQDKVSEAVYLIVLYVWIFTVESVCEYIEL